MASNGNTTGVVWTFQAGSYLITATVTPDYGYRYDGDDEDGETQAKLDAGEYVAFDTDIEVIDSNGVVIGTDSLGGSVYAWDDIADFWTAHRDADPMNRNCSIMRAAHGGNVCIGHYFPDMVANAVREARAYLLKVKARHVRGSTVDA